MTTIATATIGMMMMTTTMTTMIVTITMTKIAPVQIVAGIDA
jgi:hypothetical protein